MANWKTVQFDSSVRSQKTLRRAPHPRHAPTYTHTWKGIIPKHLAVCFVFIFVKMVYSMAIVKNNDLMSKCWLKAYSRAAHYFSNIRATGRRAICFPRTGG